MLLLACLLIATVEAHDEYPEPTFRISRAEGQVHAALGARWTAAVQDEADLTLLDPVANPQVGLAQSALEVGLSSPVDPQGHVRVQALLRVEEGIVHAGGLEAGEAWVGLDALDQVLAVQLGRDDLPVTRDRLSELEDQPHALRPALSRSALPVHADGAALALAWPRIASARGGLAWQTRTSDAPMQWARLNLSPLGRAEGPLSVELGGAFLRHPSPSLGTSVLWVADGQLRAGPVRVGGGWQRFDRPTGLLQEILAEVGLDLPLVGLHHLALDLRGERVVGLVSGEDARWLGTGRVAWAHQADPDVQGYVEALLSREQGTVATADVQVLDDRIERRNDALALGILTRW
ncbi:hypothetical protein L6R53_01605 [Myxococcota bacterium]|nr:hypothetical protein [Myxococcota bacterium]